jgi:hypothetical protein
VWCNVDGALVFKVEQARHEKRVLKEKKVRKMKRKDEKHKM